MIKSKNLMTVSVVCFSVFLVVMLVSLFSMEIDIKNLEKQKINEQIALIKDTRLLVKEEVETENLNQEYGYILSKIYGRNIRNEKTD